MPPVRPFGGVENSFPRACRSPLPVSDALRAPITCNSRSNRPTPHGLPRSRVRFRSSRPARTSSPARRPSNSVRHPEAEPLQSAYGRRCRIRHFTPPRHSASSGMDPASSSRRALRLVLTRSHTSDRGPRPPLHAALAMLASTHRPFSSAEEELAPEPPPSIGSVRGERRCHGLWATEASSPRGHGQDANQLLVPRGCSPSACRRPAGAAQQPLTGLPVPLIPRSP